MRITSALYPYRSTADATCNVHCIARIRHSAQNPSSVSKILVLFCPPLLCTGEVRESKKCERAPTVRTLCIREYSEKKKRGCNAGESEGLITCLWPTLSVRETKPFAEESVSSLWSENTRKVRRDKIFTLPSRALSLSRMDTTWPSTAENACAQTLWVTPASPAMYPCGSRRRRVLFIKQTVHPQFTQRVHGAEGTRLWTRARFVK